MKDPDENQLTEAEMKEAVADAHQEVRAKGRKPLPRAEMRARKRRVERTIRKAAPRDPRNPLILVDPHWGGEGVHGVLQPGAEPEALGAPLSIVLEGTEEDGYHVLDGDPTPSMLISHSMLKGVDREWVQTPAAWVRRVAWNDTLEVSHSEGVLVYRLHPMAWTDEGPEQNFVLAILTHTKGPKARHPKDRPRPVTVTHSDMTPTTEEVPTP